MSKIVFITPHYLEQYRKTGFFWMADAFHKQQWEVLFFTSPISFISVLNRDNRFRFPVWRERQQLIEKKPKLFSFIHFTLLHKVDFSKAFGKSKIGKLFGSIINFLLTPVCSLLHSRLGKSRDFIAQANAFVFESSPSLELLDTFIKINPKAKLIYRISDDLRLIRVHPSTKKYEQQNLKIFDLVSVPSSVLFARIRELEPTCALQLDYHCVNRQLFDSPITSPYATRSVINAVFVGIGYVDYDFLCTAVKLKPEWQFHIIGPLEKIPGDNVTHYGEIPFEKTIPYLKHANVGLQPLKYSVGAEFFTDTLKMIQYTYFGLAIIAPDFLKTERKNTFYYTPSDSESIQKALDNAGNYDKKKDTMNYNINSWDELATKWIKQLNL
jgi:2-beta-glucuronyltransferase